MEQIDLQNKEAVNRTVCSYLGILSKLSSYNIRCEMFNTEDIAQIVEFDADMLKCKPKAHAA